MSFEVLEVKPEIIRALSEMGIIEPTQIQEKAIPAIRARKDLIGMSMTGSGKTAAFGVPLLEMIQKGQGIQVLVLSPTRELAVQIAQELAKFGKYTDPSIAAVFGGVALGPQVEQMAYSEIIVATPGRLLDHLERRNLDLSHLSCIVLDEADKMVEMGFIEDIERIIDATPHNRQMLLFGATLSKEIDHIKAKYMNEPVVAEAESFVAEEQLKQYYYNIQPNEKFSLLVHLLNKEKINRAIIFCSARTTVELVTRNLRAQGLKAEMIHGKLTQNRRLQVIQNFYEGKQDILVASAVAARGLDIKDVTHIFNYDLAQDPQEYVHRVGRTARAGESGKAITLLTQKDFEVFRVILDRYRMNVEELPLEPFARIPFQTRTENPRMGFDRRNFGGQQFGPRSYDGPRRYDSPRGSDSRDSQRGSFRDGPRSFTPRPTAVYEQTWKGRK